MKSKILIGLLIIFILNSFFALADTKPNVAVLGYWIEGGNAYVGKDFVLSVNLSNIEPSTCAKAISSSVQADFPFITKGLNTVYAGDLCKSDVRQIDFPLKIDPSANGGFYQLTITNNYESTTFISFSSQSIINLYVNGQPQLDAHIISSEPVDIYAGDTAIVSVSVENTGSFRAQSVNAVMKSPAPLQVKWSKSFNSIALLEPKQSKVMDFQVEVPKNADSKIYPIMLEASYFDQNNELQKKNFSLDFYVRKKAEFETSDSGSDTFYANQDSRTERIILKNTGTDAARKIKAKILPQFPFSTDGSVRYVEMLESGASTPVDFNVNVDKDAKPGKYSLDMLLDFEDAQGKRFQDTAKVVLVVNPKGIFRSVFIDYWFLWAVAVIAFFIFGRKKIKMKK